MMGYLDDETLAELAKMARRKADPERLPPLVLLRVVQADDFRCRNCGAEVAAEPRTVITLRERIDDPDPLGRYHTACSDCRLALLQVRKERNR